MTPHARSLHKELQQLERHGLRRSLRALESCQGARIVVGGKELINFSSNDYLGLAAHESVINASIEALKAWGTGCGASRLISGNMAIHEKLEDSLARFKHTESALLYATGSMANLGVLTALAGKGDTLYLDALDHATLYDAARLSGANVRVFAHNDMQVLSDYLEQDKALRGKKLVAVDGVYSMDGDLAPLPVLKDLCLKHEALLVVDEAHATGVMGGQGTGTLEHFGLLPWDGLVQVGTLSKALGSLGGFFAGSALMRDYLINRSRSLIFATGLAPACAGAALEALRIVQDQPVLRQKLWALRQRLALGLEALGFSGLSSQAPILPVIVGRPEKAMALQANLLDRNILAAAIRPPTVPRNGSRLRLTLTAKHEDHQIDLLLGALKEAMA
jgi:8-amino-7-oxononanoate synthase